MTEMPTDAEITLAGESLARAASSPATVILFGSQARGDAGPDSDLDFLVIEDSFKNKHEEIGRLLGAVPKLGIPVDVLVATRAEAARKRQAVGSIIREALLEGRVVYESK